MIYTIYPCPISFSPGFLLPRIILPPPYDFAPWNRLLIYTIYSCPISFCPLERNCLMIYTIYPCPASFCSLDSTLGVGLLCFNRMLEQMLRCLDFTIVMFLFVLRLHTNKKNPLQQKLMIGAHPVTVAPLVSQNITRCRFKSILCRKYIFYHFND